MRNGNRQRYSLTGHISQIAIAGVNVPHPLRPVLETQRNAPRGKATRGPPLPWWNWLRRRAAAVEGAPAYSSIAGFVAQPALSPSQRRVTRPA